ncbi:jg28017 [Pararge aegeria aegeria]|uniref:Jg28017 protein n=1 Tax=Pararge aegeria aegeria TaxID=348720 RepID=A0A8S4S5Y4_9NEOP|nr:jg28017 [Pararge aegeria aegeria]
MFQVTAKTLLQHLGNIYSSILSLLHEVAFVRIASQCIPVASPPGGPGAPREEVPRPPPPPAPRNGSPNSCNKIIFLDVSIFRPSCMEHGHDGTAQERDVKLDVTGRIWIRNRRSSPTCMDKGPGIQQGALTIVRRSSSRGKSETSPPTDEQLDQLDLETEHLPAVDTPDACDKAALRGKWKANDHAVDHPHVGQT